MDDAYDTATGVLKKRKKDLKLIAEGLLEYETLSGKEISEMLDGKPLSRNQGDDTPPSRGTAVPTAGSGKPKKDGEPDSGENGTTAAIGSLFGITWNCFRSQLFEGFAFGLRGRGA